MSEPGQNPFAFDWGTVTPDGVSKENVAIHTIAHEIQTPQGIERTIRFVSARAALFERHLPPGMQQGVILDDRGQDVPAHARARLRAGLSKRLVFVKFATEGL